MSTATKKNEIATDWSNRIKAGVEFRKKYSSRSKWDEYRKMYRGQWADNIYPVNKIFSYGRMLIPKVYFRAPRISVTPLRPDLIWHAKVVETLDNMLIKQTLLKNTLKMSSLDSYLCGIGPIKLGYDSQYGYIPEQGVNDDGETATQLSTKDGRRIEYQSNIHPGMPWALRCRPEDVVVPWGASDGDSLPWIANYIVRPLSDVQEDQKYDHAARGRLAGTRQPTGLEDKGASFRPSEERDKDVPYAELWEIRDVKSHQIIVICEEELLMVTDDVLQFNGLPYEFINFNPDPEYFWSISDASILAPHQYELNDTNTQERKHRQIALLKFLYKKSGINEDELLKLLSGEVGPAVGVEGDEGPLTNNVALLQPHVPPDFSIGKQGILRDMQEALGFGPNQTGQFSPYHGKTAAETMAVEQGFENRADERRDHVGDILVNIVKKWNQMIFRFWTDQKVIKIVTPQGQPYWINYTGDQLSGDYMLHLDADSGMPFTQTLKYQMKKELLDEFNGDPLIDQVELRQMMLDSYSMVDPRAGQLLNVPEGVDPTAMAATRQPNPKGVKGGGGSRGGPGTTQMRSGPRPQGSQGQPIDIEAIARQRS